MVLKTHTQYTNAQYKQTRRHCSFSALYQETWISPTNFLYCNL